MYLHVATVHEWAIQDNKKKKKKKITYLLTYVDVRFQIPVCLSFTLDVYIENIEVLWVIQLVFIVIIVRIFIVTLYW